MKIFTLLTLIFFTTYANELREICSEYSELCQTKCCDGNYSTSSSTGACSYHGGVCNEEKSTQSGYYLLKYIIDGDTIVFDDFKCRLYGIDTPESQYGSKLDRDRQMCSVNEDFMLEAGKKATNFTKSILTFQNYQIDIKGEDFYGRKECIIYIDDNKSLNEELIENGYAIAWQEYIDEEYLKEIYLYKQNLAKKNQVGLWENYKSVIECLVNRSKVDILEINLNSGWNLVGVDRDIDKLNSFFTENIKEVLLYRDKWLSLKEINNLNKFDGFWIKVNNSSYLKSEIETKDKSFKIKNGWQLKSFNKRVDNFDIFRECIDSIWLFKDDKWLFFDFETKEFESIDKSKGFWINGKKECEIDIDN